jgi:two-component system response regulator PilR (NtrC family)
MVASNPERPAVVLVDPHEDCRLIYPAILRHAGYDVLLATTVAEARDLLAQRRPVAVVAEARLPDGAAGDLVRALAESVRMRPCQSLSSMPFFRWESGGGCARTERN